MLKQMKMNRKKFIINQSYTDKDYKLYFNVKTLILTNKSSSKIAHMFDKYLRGGK